jgi:hypothetical protein
VGAGGGVVEEGEEKAGESFVNSFAVVGGKKRGVAALDRKNSPFAKGAKHGAPGRCKGVT